MKCPVCGKVNKPEAKFCKHCGSKIDAAYKTCPNGHNYDSKLESCPYCPNPEVSKSINDAITSAKTVIDHPKTKQTEHLDATVIDKNKTKIETKVISGQEQVERQKTTISKAGKKLTGWLVSFDIDKNGKDFKIFEGKTKIGSHSSNDIVLNYPDVSDEHVLIASIDNKFILQDQLSVSGTYVNENPVEERIQLNDNDVVKIGSISFKVKII